MLKQLMGFTAACLAAFLLLFLAFYIVIWTALGIWTLKSSPSEQMYKIDSHQKELIKIASKYVDGYLAGNKKLPSSAEFHQWVYENKHKYPRLEGVGMYLITSGFEEDLVQVVGRPSQNGYVLNFWEGDIHVNYPSWGKNDMAYITDEDYFSFGSKCKSALIFLSPSILAFSLCIYLVSKKFMRRGGLKS